MENWVAKVVFLIQMLSSNFRRPLQSLLFRYSAEMFSLPNFNMLFQLVLTKVFKSEQFSCLPKVGHCDQVMQRAYSRRSDI